MSDLKSIKLLIVEDEEVQRDILKRHLKGFGGSIFIATNKSEAIELLDSHYFHVALLDIKLDGNIDSDNEDGMEVAKRIQESGEGTSVIMLSGFGTVQRTRDAVIDYGAIDFLEKTNYVKADLLKIVEKAANQALTEFDRKFLQSFEKQPFVSFENFRTLEPVLKHEQMTDTLGILNELLRPLIPVVMNSAAFEQIERDSTEITLESKYWSRKEGKAYRIMLGTRGLVRKHSESFKDDPTFAIRNRDKVAGFRCVDPTLTSVDFSKLPALS